MTVSEIDLYNILKKKVGDKEADTLVNFVKAEVKGRFEEQKNQLATKEDLALLKADMANFKADIIKWMFIFWVGQLAAVFAFLKFLA